MSTLSYAPELASRFIHPTWNLRVRNLSKRYRIAQPFPHIHLAPFLNQPDVETMAAEFPRAESAQWIHYKHANENKNGLSRRDLFPPTLGKLVDELNSEPFVSWLRK